MRTGLVQRGDGQEITPQEARAARRGRRRVESAVGGGTAGVRAGTICLGIFRITRNAAPS